MVNNISKLISYTLLLSLLLWINCSDNSYTNNNLSQFNPIIVWKDNGKNIAPSNVDTIEIQISYLDQTVIERFPFSAHEAIFDKIPIGTTISVSIKGINRYGEVVYAGFVKDFTVDKAEIDIVIPVQKLTPLAPTNFRIVTKDSSKIEFAWSNRDTLPVTFNVYRQVKGDSLNTIIGEKITESIFTDSTLDAQTVYLYKVKSVNGNGTSTLFSNTIETSLNVKDTIKPIITLKSHTNFDTLYDRLIPELYGSVSDNENLDSFFVNGIYKPLSHTEWYLQDQTFPDGSNSFTVILSAKDKSTPPNITTFPITLYYKDTINPQPFFITQSEELPVEVMEGTQTSFTLRAKDTLNSPIKSYYCSIEDIIIKNDTIQWTPQEKDIGKKKIYFTAKTDKGAISNPLIWEVTVLKKNHAPSFTTTNDSLVKALTQAVPYQDTLHALDPDNDSLQFSSNDSTIIFDANIFTIRPTLSDITPQKTVLLFVKDHYQYTDTLKWTFAVKRNEKPRFDSLQLPAHIIEDMNFSYHLKATDPEGDTIIYGSNKNFISFSNDTLFWTPLSEHIGKHIIELYAHDTINKERDTISWSVTVTRKNRPPKFTTVSKDLIDTIKVGTLYQYPLSIQDPDEDPVIVRNNYDSTILQNTTIEWRPTPKEVGEKVIYFTVKDSINPVVDTLLWNVTIIKNEIPHFLTKQEELPKTFKVGDSIVLILMAQDPEGDQLFFSSSHNSHIIEKNRIDWTPTNNDTGTHTIHFMVKDSISSDADTLTWNVTISPRQRPSAPINILSTGQEKQIQLQWDKMTYATSYKVYYSSSDNITGASLYQSCTENNFTHAIPTDGTTYYYRIQAIGPDGSSELSATTTGKTFEKGLIAHYPLGTNCNDISPHNFHGTIQGEIKPVSDRFGDTLGASEFGQQSNYIDLSKNIDKHYGNELSISTWVKLNKNATSETFNTIYSDWNTSHSIQFGLYRLKPQFTISFTESLVEYTLTTTNHLMIDTWYHIVAIYSRGTIKLYVNGIEECTQETNESNQKSLLITNQNKAIGSKSSEFNEPFYGCIDDFRLYAQTLSLNEIQGIYTENGWPTVVKTPTNFKGQLNSPFTLNRGTLQWDSVDGATDYDIYKVTDNISTIDTTVVKPYLSTSNTTAPVKEIPFDKETSFFIRARNKFSLSNISTPIVLKPTSDEDLLFYYPMNGNSDDWSGKKFHGVQSGTTSIPNFDGKSEGALSFENSTDFIEIPASLESSYGNELTIAAWIKMYKHESFNVLYGDWHLPTQEAIHYGLENGKLVLHIITEQTGRIKASSSNSIPLNAWTHVVLTINNSGELTFYINGTVNGGSSGFNISTLVKTGVPKTIGNKNNKDHRITFHGGIDDFYFYKRALSQDEITELAKP